MSTDNSDNDEDSIEPSELRQEERTDRTLLGELSFAALAGLVAFISAVLTTVVEDHSVWRPIWLTVCIVCLLLAVGLIVRGARNFSGRS